MKRSLTFIILILSVQATSGRSEPVKFTNGEAIFVLKDDVKHPFFWWPSTLLHYQVQFENGVIPADLVLTERESGKVIPFQLSRRETTREGYPVYTLSMISDLPSGGLKTFVLRTGTGGNRFPEISAQKDGDFIVIRSNKITVRIPDTQDIRGIAPGPVIQVFPSDGRPMGESVFDARARRLQKIETKKIASGPVFTEYRIGYLFEDGARYYATVKCIRDYEFIELSEETSGIERTDSISWTYNCQGFSPTHRQAPNHPYGGPGDAPGFARYNWEKIDQTRLNYHHGVMPDPKERGKIPYQVGLYEPWPAERTVTSALFWDENKNESVGVFLTDAAYWNDEDYAIWHSSGLLNIQFYYTGAMLSLVYPVAEGTRATAISCYAHDKDITLMNDLEEKSSRPVSDPLGFNVRARMSQLSYNHFLQNRFGTIHLDKVKDWVLTYPDTARLSPVIFEHSRFNDEVTFMRRFLSSGYHSELAVSGPRQNSGYAPVPAREFNDAWVTSFNRFYPRLNKEQKARVASLYLLHAYVAADEEYMPMKYMLSGHPNFLADVKTIPGLVAFQFPDHPEAERWSGLFERYVQLNTRYHTRPDVKAWNAQGGRWTENLGTYVWAFLRPTLRTAYVLKESSGKNTIANASVSSIGSWILNTLSAPYDGESLDFYRRENGTLAQHDWGIVTKEEGPRRVHPPQGAHSARRKPASSLWFLGSMLQNYDPLLAEHLRYVARPTDDDMESFVDENEPFNIMFPKSDYDRGTRPDFKTIKLTGYGNILRAATDTPDELSVHLCQIDKGHNYRWGVAGQGGSGMIYFYAGGKSYSHNGREDSGDRRLQDTDMMTSFGVYKNGYFKSIGQNVLHRPLYNLGTAQFTEITADDKDPYSWPEYQSRSVLLVDDDYFVTFDDVYNNNITGRFSWFTHPLEELPVIEIVKTGKPRDGYKKTEIKTSESKGVWYDTFGDCLAFISHKKGFAIEAAPFGATIVTPEGGTDYIYRNDSEVEVADGDKVFTGTAGFMRVHADGKQEFVLFHGRQIGNGRFLMKSEDTDAGISAALDTDGVISGKFYSQKAATITFWRDQIAGGMKVYVDGKEQRVAINANSFTVDFPEGEHAWQITRGLPIPMRSGIISSENDNGRVNIFFAPSAGSQRYRIELSRDNGARWETLGETTHTSFRVESVQGMQKAHVRVIAVNREHAGEASAAYPVYFTKEKPPAPDGLKVTLTADGANLTWGKVLGVRSYRLYRREEGKEAYVLIHSGEGNSFSDNMKSGDKIYSYTIAGVNRNGTSDRSQPVDTDPDSWLHWDPKPGEKFRRTNTTIGADKSAIYYPD